MNGLFFWLTGSDDTATECSAVDNVEIAIIRSKLLQTPLHIILKKRSI